MFNSRCRNFCTFLAHSGSQDIRNIIPFSGRGFVLGGSTQPSAPTQKSPFQSPPRSQQPLQEPSPPSPADLRPLNSASAALPKRSVSNHKAFVNINGSPVRVTKTNGSLVRPKQRTVQDLFQTRNLKSPKKTLDCASDLNSDKTSWLNKSSSSTSGSAGSPFSKYFAGAKKTEIPDQVKPQNGIPGFISKPFEIRKSSTTGISGSGPTSQIKPVNSVPNSTSKHFGSTKSSATGTTPSSSTSSNPTCFRSIKEHGTSSPIKSEYRIPNSNLKHLGNQKGSECGTSGVRLSGSPEKSGSFIPASSSRSPHKPGSAAGGRKRWREDRNSALIFDFFQRVSHSPASSSSPSLISREQREEGSASRVPSAGVSGGGSALLSSTALTVTCPVCQSKVLESQINQHLDSCLM